MKITLIGSTQYKDKFLNYQRDMEKKGHSVKIPAFDDFTGYDELDVCEHNRKLIEWADEVHVIWDNRSIGTVFDFGMAFALRKPIQMVYLEPKTVAGVMQKYQAACEHGRLKQTETGT